MVNQSQVFGKILEQYVFEVANAFIESAEPAIQSRIINLFNRIDPAPTSSEVVDDQPSLSLTQQSGGEWDQLLNRLAN